MRRVLSPNSRPTTFNTPPSTYAFTYLKQRAKPRAVGKTSEWVGGCFGWKAKENSFLAHFKAHYTALEASGVAQN